MGMVRRMTIGARSSTAGPTRLVRHMARLLATEGAAYPMAGALSSAVRGRQNLSRCRCAEELGLTLEQIDAAESGRTPLHQLPEQITERIPWLGLDLTALPADPPPGEFLPALREH